MCMELGSTRPDPWEPYRDHIEGRLASCADYLSRLSRSLAGEIASDRHYFGEKARALRDAAGALVEACVDVEHWMGQCGGEFVVDQDQGLWSVCVLGAGHTGPHDDTEGRSATESAYRKTLRLIGAAQRAADVLGGLPWGREDDTADPETAGLLDAAASEVVLAGWLARSAGDGLVVLRAPRR
jgi:hypothetical protein